MSDEYAKGSYGAQVNDEYSSLLDFIKAQKASNADEGEQNETHIVRKREFLRPWKVHETRVNKDGEEETVAQKVPASWCVSNPPSASPPSPAF